ncbi:MAG TPA: carbon starvation protein A [Firmicutes bacterium]|nr:carbon starvation protein A [Bacillota bacterium]
MTALLAIIGGAIYIIGYMVYGKRLEKEVVKADPNRPTPAVKLRDNVDYMPANKFVLYGHHFASIAGAGPIVGPALAVVWGWLPSILWIWFGNLFIGSVHDYLALMASVRYDGKSVQWISGKLMTPKTKYAFELFVYFALLLVIAAFMNVFGGLAAADPKIATASILFIIVAMIEGYIMYRTKMSFSAASIIGVILLVLAIVLGFQFPFIKIANIKTWYVIQFVYVIIAASLPVWILLQPRDYLNAYILWFGLIIGAIAALIAFRGFTWPAFTVFSPNLISGQPSPFWPTVPLIIACGALSGFHSIVASGTSSKQLDNELSGLLVGYGGMFTEGFLSTIVVLSIAAFGMTVLKEAGGDMAKLASPALIGKYGAGQIGATVGKVGIFTHSFGKLVNVIGIPEKLGVTFGGLWVSAFVLTTLDTSNRLARFAWGEIWEPVKKTSEGFYKFIANKWVGSIIAAALGMLIVWGGTLGSLWPGFAGANQMLASIAMITAAVWVRNVQKAKKAWQYAVLIPALFLWITVTVALIWYLFVAVPAIKAATTKYPVAIFTIIMIILNFILIGDFFSAFRKGPKPEAEVK